VTERNWSKEAYEASVSSRCWWFTPYDDGWEHSDLKHDTELRDIVAMEQALGGVPDWAERIVEGCIRYAAPCGHHLFPRPYLEIVSAIGSEKDVSFRHTCYTVERGRKREMMDYCLCLDAWLAGADSEAPAKELMDLGYRKIDWHRVCSDLWQVLGERTELKRLLVERTLLQTRWWIKSSVWDDDMATDFGRDQYLGDYAEAGCFATDNGNPELRAPTFKLGSSFRIQELEARLSEACKDWRWFRNLIVDGSWPCAPKAFRYLERLLWSIGKERPAVDLPSYPLEDGDDVPDFLQAADTCPDRDQAIKWWGSFLSALTGWWRGRPEEGAVADDVSERLGDVTEVKRWLVRLLVRRLAMLARDSKIGRLVSPGRGRAWGTRPVHSG